MEDASLDEFLDGGEDDGGEDAERVEESAERAERVEERDEQVEESLERAEQVEEREEKADRVEESDETARVDPGGVEPARTTAQWTPSGSTCEACGRDVERRWIDDGALVCPACKEW